MRVMLGFVVVGVLLSADAVARADPPQAFSKICAVCHGDDAKGGGGPALIPMERELAEVLAIVREGFGQMPPISAREVSDDQVKEIYDFLKSGGQPQQAPPAASVGGRDSVRRIRP